MCETGYAAGCEARDAYSIETNRIANPGRTPVRLGACRDCLPTALDEQLRNNAELQEQGMPGVRAGTRDIGVTVIMLAPEPDEESESSERSAD